MKIKSLRLMCVFGIVFCLQGCGLFRPYKIDITQGNDISEAAVEQVQAGMSKAQVQYLLGTPLLQDVFHTQRWDYIYTHKPGYQPLERRHVAVYFDGDQVSKVTLDVIDRSAT